MPDTAFSNVQTCGTVPAALRTAARHTAALHTADLPPPTAAPALAVIDAAVPEGAALVAAMAAPHRVARIGPDGDALAALTGAIAASGGDAGAIHLFCHGAPGSLRLAGGRIDLGTLAAGWHRVAELRRVLAGRPLILYGCSVGEGDRGRSFVEALSVALAAPVLASATPSGGSARGGDWALDVAAGAPHDRFPSLLDPDAADRWLGLLIDVTNTNGDTSAGSLGAATGDRGVTFRDLGDAAVIDLEQPLALGDGDHTVRLRFGGDTSSVTIGGESLTYNTRGFTCSIGDGNTLILNSDLIAVHSQPELYVYSGTLAVNGSAPALRAALLNPDSTLEIQDMNLELVHMYYDASFRFSKNTEVSGRIVVFRDSNNPDGRPATFDTNGHEVTLSGPLSNSGNVTKAGAGTLTLSGSNTYSGTTTVSQGTLSVASDGNLGTGTVALDGGALAVTGATTIDNAVTVGAGGGTLHLTADTTFSGTLSGTGGLTKTGSSTLTLSGTNSFTGPTTVSAGTLRLAGGNALDDNATVTVADGATLDLNGTDETVGALAGSGTIVTGNASITLSNAGAGSFAGRISGTGPFRIAPGVTLRGTGTYTTPIEVQAGATIAPGNSPGIISTGNLTLASGSTATMEIDGPAAGTGYDQIAVTGTVTINSATLNTVFGYSSSTGHSYVLISNDGADAVTGTFNGLAEGATFSSGGRQYQISYTGNDGNDVTLTDVTSPAESDLGPYNFLGSSGDETFFGSDGDDTVTGMAGYDQIYGGSGADLAYGNLGSDLLYGNQGLDTLYGGQDNDTAFGGQDADLVYGNLGSDVLYGNLAADTLYGGQDTDALFGGQGGDVLFGNLGDDTLYGGRGDDLLHGGGGADLIVVQTDGGNDVLADFDGAAGDRIQISADVNASGIDSYAELVAAASDTDAGVLIALGNDNSLTLSGVTLAQLQSDWFAFG